MEAKLWYTGDWHCRMSAYMHRWQIMSKEVQRVIGIELLVQSVGHSGWNEADYYKATMKTYFSWKPDIHMEKLKMRMISILGSRRSGRSLETMKNGKQPYQNRKKRKSGGSISTNKKLDAGTGTKPLDFHLSGQKKVKLGPIAQ